MSEIIVYNLVKYLSTNLPTINFVCNGLQKNSPDELVEIDESGGVPNQYHNRNDYIIRMLSRSISKPSARKYLSDVYTLIHKKFGLLLPEETVASVTYPEVQTYRIVGTTLPVSQGSDENGKNLFSVNFIITTE